MSHRRVDLCRLWGFDEAAVGHSEEPRLGEPDETAFGWAIRKLRPKLRQESRRRRR